MICPLDISVGFVLHQECILPRHAASSFAILATRFFGLDLHPPLRFGPVHYAESSVTYSAMVEKVGGFDVVNIGRCIILLGIWTNQ